MDDTQNRAGQATHTVYRIVCFPTGKVYVGQTNNYRIRRTAHLRELRYNRHFNAHLQAAYNKYGSQAFYFEVLERYIAPEDVNEREQYWIEYFDSCRDGFNNTGGGHGAIPRSIPCTWNGIEYPSLSAAARAQNITPHAMKLRLERGYTGDSDMTGNGTATPCVWNGIEYPSISAAARALGIGAATMYQRVSAGQTCDADIKGPASKACTWNNIPYPSMSAAARSLGISLSAMENRLRQGYSRDEDVPKFIIKPRPCIWNGIEYPSVSTAAKALKISKVAMRERIEHGHTCDDDIRHIRTNRPSKPHAGRVPCVWNGIKYASITAAARAQGITTVSMHLRLRRGYTCDDDMPNPGGALPVVLDGVEYPSLSAASKAIGKHRDTIKKMSATQQP